MKITLISPYPDITAFGIRTISAYLKSRGHETQLIFVPDPFGDNLVFGVKRYEDSVLDALIPLCKDSDIIGITLMTNFFEGSVQITKKLKEGLKAPVIWGGIHATIRPEESLEYADIVCVGDGEDAVLELVSRMEKGEPYLDVKNLWFKDNETVIKNPPRNLSHDLDVYPRPDYSMEDHHIMHNGRMQTLSKDIMKSCFEKSTALQKIGLIAYQTMTGRGCPHKCTYCINDTLKEMYNNDNYLRWRSTAHVIDELLWAKENLPYVGYILISDDAFFARDKKSFEGFCKEYKEKINLPLSCLASPMTISEEKMGMLVDAGLIDIQMGVESGSKKIQVLFNRKQMDNERLMKAFLIINKYKDRILPPRYDFILDVPYETDVDKIENLKLIAKIPKPFHIQAFSLVLYPRTKLYEQAKMDGLIADEKKEIYNRSYAAPDLNYLNLLISVSKNGRFPSAFLKFLVSPPIVKILNNGYLRPFFRYLYLSLKNINRLIKNGKTG